MINGESVVQPRETRTSLWLCRRSRFRCGLGQCARASRTLSCIWLRPLPLRPFTVPGARSAMVHPSRSRSPRIGSARRAVSNTAECVIKPWLLLLGASINHRWTRITEYQNARMTNMRSKQPHSTASLTSVQGRLYSHAGSDCMSLKLQLPLCIVGAHRLVSGALSFNTRIDSLPIRLVVHPSC